MHWSLPSFLSFSQEPCSSTQSAREHILGAVINEAVLGDIVFPNRLTVKFQDVIGALVGSSAPFHHIILRAERPREFGGFFFGFFFFFQLQLRQRVMEWN